MCADFNTELAGVNGEARHVHLLHLGRPAVLSGEGVLHGFGPGRLGTCPA